MYNASFSLLKEVEIVVTATNRSVRDVLMTQTFAGSSEEWGPFNDPSPRLCRLLTVPEKIPEKAAETRRQHLCFQFSPAIGGNCPDNTPEPLVLPRHLSHTLPTSFPPSVWQRFSPSLHKLSSTHPNYHLGSIQERERQDSRHHLDDHGRV